jgi:small subunit ribosomal protein S21e
LIGTIRSSWTNRIIAAKDHSSVQIAVGRVNANGVYTGENDNYALAGYIRGKGEGDLALTELVRKADAHSAAN